MADALESAPAVETGQPAAPAVQAEATPALPPDLVAAMEAHNARFPSVKTMKAEQAAPAQEAAKEEPTTAAASEQVDEVVTGDPAPVVPEPKKDPAAPDDEVATRLARYMAQERAIRAQAKQMAEERKAWAAREAKVKQLEELESLRTTNPVEYVRRTVPREALEGTFVVDLLNAPEDGSAPPLTEEQQAEKLAAKAMEIAQAKLKEEEAAKAKAAEEAAKAKEEANKAAYYTGVAAELEQKAEQYPYLAAEGIDVETFDRTLRAHHKATGKVPTPDMLFRHFDKKLEQKAASLLQVYQKRTGAQPAQKPAPVASPPSRSASPVTVDTRGRVPESKPELKGYARVLAEREEIIARLNAQHAGR